jgi:iron complex outermembrane receptor protein
MNTRDRMLIALVLGTLLVVSRPLGAQSEGGQDAGNDEPAVEEIVIRGFRYSLDVALDAKRDATSAIDMIVAEDIADFPDLNLAEAIQRVPGVSIQRDAGEGRQITVRGLGPEFTRIKLNGVEAMSANGGTDAAGGTNRQRNFDFNTFASELFNAITVRKTATASTEEGSLGATVDLRSARPFDYDGFTIATSLTGAYNDISEEVDPRAALLVSNTFAEDKLGALFSAAYTERNLIDEGSSTVRWASACSLNPMSPAFLEVCPSPTTPNFVPRLPRYDHYEHAQERLGLTGALQFRPSESTEFALDVLFARFDAERSEIFLEIPNFSAGQAGLQAVDVEVDGNNSVVAGTFNNVDIRTEQRFDELRTDFTQVTLDASHAFSDTVKVNALVGFAEADHENPVQTTMLFDWNNIPSITYDYRGDARLPVITYNGVDLTSTTIGAPQTAAGSIVNSNGWYLSQIRLRPQSSINSFTSYQADLQWEPWEGKTFSVGAQFKDFTFETTELRRNPFSCAPPLPAPNSNAEGCITAAQRAVPLSSYANVFTFGDDLGIPSGTTVSFLLPDPALAAEVFGLYDPASFPLAIGPSLNNNRTVEEDDLGVFAQFDFTTELAGLPLRGNVGVRYVQTDQFSTGFSFLQTGPTAGSITPVEATRDYTDTLPALNLAMNLTDEFIVRLGASKVMSRPQLGTLTPGGTVNVSGNNRTAAIGNPLTDPTRANAYDLGLEWYFANESLLGLALFYKDIKSRPQTISLTSQVFTGNPFGIPDSVAVAACGNLPNCAPDLPIWTFTSTVNGEGGRLRGFEFSYQQPFTFLPSALRNFGAIVNFTWVDSEINYVNPVTGQTDTADLTGLSNTAYNATLYYETDRFGARVSAAFRDEYLDPTAGVPGRDGNNLEGVAETLTIDAAARFNITDGIAITFEGLNLTDEFQDQWVDQAANRLSFYHHTGRNYMLGVRAKF